MATVAILAIFAPLLPKILAWQLATMRMSFRSFTISLDIVIGCLRSLLVVYGKLLWIMFEMAEIAHRSHRTTLRSRESTAWPTLA